MPVSQVLYLVVSQVVTKAVAFASKQLLLRQLSPEIFGIAAFLEFFTNSVLFFSREAVRVSYQRANSESAIRKFACLPLLLCGPIFIGFLYIQSYADIYQSTVSRLPYFRAVATLTILLISLELFAEPLFAVNQHNLNFKLRSKVESIAVVVKCVTILALVGHGQNNHDANVTNSTMLKGQAVFAFACGQLVYSAAIFCGYWVGTRPSKSPSTNDSQDEHYFDRGLLSIWKLLFLQTIFKHLLTEGDTMFISYLFAATQQGVYSVIANYGSMVARLLFQPIEELIRVSFTKSFALKTPDYASAHSTMAKLVVFYFNLSLLIVVGGYTNGPYMLRFLLGRSERWHQSSVFEDFPRYVLYIPFMAFNGILEAFFSSASSQAQISQFSLFMSLLNVFVFTLMYIFVGRLGWGIRGLILANVANMSLRIGYCVVFYVRFFKGHVTLRAKDVLKRVYVPLLLAESAMFLHHTLFKDGRTSSPLEFAQSLLICVVCLTGMLVNEKDQIVVITSRFRRKGKQE